MSGLISNVISLRLHTSKALATVIAAGCLKLLKPISHGLTVLGFEEVDVTLGPAVGNGSQVDLGGCGRRSGGDGRWLVYGLVIVL